MIPARGPQTMFSVSLKVNSLGKSRQVGGDGDNEQSWIPRAILYMRSKNTSSLRLFGE